MDKVFQISLGGQIFTVEEKAYEVLNNYINALEAHFKDNEDVVQDIEQRMGELLLEQLGKQTTVYINHVNHVINTLGKVEELTDGAAYESSHHSSNNINHDQTSPKITKLRRNPYDESLGGVCSGVAAFFDIDPVIVRVLFVISLILYGTGILFYLILWAVLPKATGEEAALMLKQKQLRVKKLFRDSDNRAIAGVASGLAKYFSLDTVWIRLAFVVSLLLFGSGFWLYIILWVIVPKTVTVSDKLLMNGQEPNVSNFGKHGSNPALVQPKQGTLYRLFKASAKLLLGFIAFILFITLISVSVALVAVYFGLGNVQWLNQLIALTIKNNALIISAKIGVLLVIISPILALLLVATVALFKVKLNRAIWAYTLASLFIIGSGLLIYSGISFAGSVNKHASKNIYTNIEKKDTLLIDGIEIPQEFDSELTFNDKGVVVTNDRVYFEIDNFEIKQTVNDQIKVKVKLSSNGSNIADAGECIKEIMFEPKIEGNNILIPHFFYLNQASATYKWQEVSVTLFVPKGTVMHFSESAKEILDDHNIEEADGNWYLMKDNNLICKDCEGEEDENIKIDMKIGDVKMKINNKSEDEEININLETSENSESVDVNKRKTKTIKKQKKETSEVEN